jgi:predicted nuclease of predicted toxin-antitoxin system
MNVILDMNLSPEWVEVLKKQGHRALHWQEVGDPKAEDTEILEWATKNGYVVFTNDLDFGRLLALTFAGGPSVLQIRGGHLLPEDAGDIVTAALTQCEQELVTGAVVSIDEASWRVRILPIR